MNATITTKPLAERNSSGFSLLPGVSAAELRRPVPHVRRGLCGLLCVMVVLHYCSVAERGMVAGVEATKQGRPVTFGSAICLVHAATGYK